MGILLMGCIRGLASEGELVHEAVLEHGPDVVGISISKESLQAMAEHFRSKSELPEPANFEEEMYIEGVSQYGEVIRPPPCFSEAWRAAEKQGIELKALDMDDEHFTAAFCKHISALEIIRQGRCSKKWARHAFVANSPKEFVLEWDSVINWLPGYKSLERAREEWIARGISKLDQRFDRVLAVVEYERVAGVCESLNELDKEYQTLESDS